MKLLPTFAFLSLWCVAIANIVEIHTRKFNFPEIRSGLTMRTDRYRNTGNKSDFSKLGVIIPKSYSIGICNNALISDISSVQCDIPESGKSAQKQLAIISLDKLAFYI